MVSKVPWNNLNHSSTVFHLQKLVRNELFGLQYKSSDWFPYEHTSDMKYVNVTKIMFPRCAINSVNIPNHFIVKINNSTSLNYKIQLEWINPFHATGLYLYPLKTSENQKFSHAFRGYGKRPVVQNLIIIGFTNIFNQNLIPLTRN